MLVLWNTCTYKCNVHVFNAIVSVFCQVEEQRRLRVQIADEKSAIAAKQQMKKSSKRLVHQQSGKRASITDETMDSGYYGRDAVARQEEKLEWLG